MSVVIALQGDDELIRTAVPKPPIPRHMNLVDMFGSGLIASPEYVGALRTVQVGDSTGSSPSGDLWTAPLGGRFSHLAGDLDCQDVEPGDASVSGSTIAYLDTPAACTTGATTELVVRDLRHPRRRRVIATGAYAGLDGVRLAGRFLAWSYFTDAQGDGTAIAVYDRAARRIAYRITPHRLGGAELLGFALQGDGKLAVAYGLPGRASLAWVGFPGGGVHRLAGADPQADPVNSRGDQTPVAIAGNRIAFLRRGALTVADLKGHRQLVRRFGAMRLEVGDFAFDGRRLAWAEQHVTGSQTTCIPDPCVIRPTGPTVILSAAVP